MNTRHSTRLFLAAALLTPISCQAPEDEEVSKSASGLHINYGSWQVGVSTDILAPHAVLLKTGKVLFWGGSQNDPYRSLGTVNNFRLYDPANGSVTSHSGPSKDFFCSGHVVARAGWLHVAGGHEYYPPRTTRTNCTSNCEENSADFTIRASDPNAHGGHFTGPREVWALDPDSMAWSSAGEMWKGRWYPGMAMVNEWADFIMMSGHPSFWETGHKNYAISFSFGYEDLTRPGCPPGDVLPTGGCKFYDYSANEFDQRFYPRSHLLSDGSVFFATKASDNRNHRIRVDWPTKTWTDLGAVGTDNPLNTSGGSGLYDDIAGTSVLMPYRLTSQTSWTDDQVMLTNARFPLTKKPLLNQNWVKTVDRNSWPDLSECNNKATDSNGTCRPNRIHGFATILPTGDIFVSGGVHEGGVEKALSAEMYRTDLNQWHILGPRPTVPRNYHNVALLLPDGRVWTASGNKMGRQSKQDGRNAAADYREKRIETFRPWYFSVTRPTITSLLAESVPNNNDIYVQTPQWSTVSKCAIMRPGSATHAWNSDQRYVELPIIYRQNGWIGCRLPAGVDSAKSFMTPAGYYLVYISTPISGNAAGSHVPSVGKWINIDVF